MEFRVLRASQSRDSLAVDPEGFNVAAEQAIFWTPHALEKVGAHPEASRRRNRLSCATATHRSRGRFGFCFVQLVPSRWPDE